MQITTGTKLHLDQSKGAHAKPTEKLLGPVGINCWLQEPVSNPVPLHESPREDGETKAGCSPCQTKAVWCVRVMAMSKARSGRLKFPPLVFFPPRGVAFPWHWTAQLYLPLLALSPYQHPLGFQLCPMQGCVPVTSFDGSSSPAGPHRADKKLLCPGEGRN